MQRSLPRNSTTDRDLMVRVLSAELDARATPLHDVMTPGPVTVSIDDTEEQAAKLMRARHVRRLPIVHGRRAVGIITLDDLLMGGAIDITTAGEIVEAQLAEPSASGGKPAGAPYPTRAGRDVRQ